jgi:hypothetical protein
MLDSDHVHHVQARAWLKANIKHGWASCPLTQNGCIRIMSQPGYPNALPAAAVAERLAAATATNHHVFWPDAVSMLDAGRIVWSAVLGSRRVTDVYLLALAVQQDGLLVTLDRAVPLKAVLGAKARHLVVI